jgi:hypothetical protein
MKRLLISCGLTGVMALSLIPSMTGHTSAQTVNPTPTPAVTSTPAATSTPAPIPTPAPPFTGAKRSIMASVDTVQGAGGRPAPAIGCSQTNLFRQGQVVVFRLWGINVKLGGVSLAPKNVKSIELLIPGVAAPLVFAYGNHGTVAFWAVPWRTTSTTSIGLVDYTVVIKTKTVKYQGKTIKSFTSKYTQQGLAMPSRLTITP